MNDESTPSSETLTPPYGKVIDVHRISDILPSSRPRHGRRFLPIQELTLTEDALWCAQKLPNAHAGVLVITEMTGPFGIPDFVALVGSRHRLENRLSSTVPPLLNEIDAGIVSTLHPTLPRRISWSQKKLQWPEDSLLPRIPALLQSGAIFETEKGRYIRNEAIETLGRVYAIETKISNWRRALQQGRTYQTWADAYILILEKVSEGAMQELKRELDYDNAGLMIDKTWHRRPRLRATSNARRLWAAEYLTASLVDNYQPSSFPYKTRPE